MIKKEYIQPNTNVFNVVLQPMLNISDNLGSDSLHDGGVDNSDPTDPGNKDNRSRRYRDRWDDEEDDYDY
jgi:hypothetical protein